MIVKIKRGKPVNAVLEVDDANIVRTEVMDRGGRLYFSSGDIYALNSLEWAQWISRNEPASIVADPQPVLEFEPVPWEDVVPVVAPPEKKKSFFKRNKKGK